MVQDYRVLAAAGLLLMAAFAGCLSDDPSKEGALEFSLKVVNTYFTGDQW